MQIFNKIKNQWKKNKKRSNIYCLKIKMELIEDEIIKYNDKINKIDLLLEECKLRLEKVPEKCQELFNCNNFKILISQVY